MITEILSYVALIGFLIIGCFFTDEMSVTLGCFAVANTFAIAARLSSLERIITEVLK